MFRAFDISASALTMNKLRMDTIAQNIANVQTTRTADGQPYRRKVVVVGEKEFAKSFPIPAEAASDFRSGVKQSEFNRIHPHTKESMIPATWMLTKRLCVDAKC